MGKMVWYLKQLLPLRYETEYIEGGIRYFESWRMWFGRCFGVRRFKKDFMQWQQPKI